MCYYCAKTQLIIQFIIFMTEYFNCLNLSSRLYQFRINGSMIFSGKREHFPFEIKQKQQKL